MRGTKSGGSSGTRPNKTPPPAVSPTVLEWTKALEAAVRCASPHGATAVEIAAETGVPVRIVRDRLRELIAAGRAHAVPCGGVVVAISGVSKRVTSYVLTAKKKGKGKR